VALTSRFLLLGLLWGAALLGSTSAALLGSTSAALARPTATVSIIITATILRLLPLLVLTVSVAALTWLLPFL
jgi:hypothetical protein